ncbi:hypothetical protein [Ideonella sp. A 288]|uniref:hypothetical protein n=1 Tax=Ideonella sp. A 288 TaxID=1962181 RepID=UPI0011866A60|nr:hypothetical protein [Ideonella sp. A 288]
MQLWMILLALVLAGCGSTPPAPQPTPARPSKPTGRSPAEGAAASAPTRPRAAPHAASAPPPAAAASAPAPAFAPVRGPLAAEHRWLWDLFAGTPVLVVGEVDGAVRVDVPVRHAFDAGGSQPRPALQAVLQRLGLSLSRHPTARLTLSAPEPGGADRERAMREQMLAQGLAPHRVSATPGTAPGDAVKLRMASAPGAIVRLRDSDLPAAPAATLTPPARR